MRALIIVLMVVVFSCDFSSATVKSCYDCNNGDGHCLKEQGIGKKKDCTAPQNFGCVKTSYQFEKCPDNLCVSKFCVSQQAYPGGGMHKVGCTTKEEGEGKIKMTTTTCICDTDNCNGSMNVRGVGVWLLVTWTIFLTILSR